MNINRLQPLGDPGWASFETEYEEEEAKRQKALHDANHFQATGEIPADYVPDYSASSSPFHTADEWLALQAKHAKDAS